MADIFQKRDEVQKLSERGEVARAGRSAASNNSEKGKFETQVTKPVTIPEHNILQIMNKMEILERKMQDTAAFLGLYSEMRELEAKFLEAVKNAESGAYPLSDNVKKRIKTRKDKMLKRK